MFNFWTHGMDPGMDRDKRLNSLMVIMGHFLMGLFFLRWTKLEPTSEEAKKLVSQYWKWEGKLLARK